MTDSSQLIAYTKGHTNMLMKFGVCKVGIIGCSTGRVDCYINLRQVTEQGSHCLLRVQQLSMHNVSTCVCRVYRLYSYNL